LGESHFEWGISFWREHALNLNDDRGVSLFYDRPLKFLAQPIEDENLISRFEAKDLLNMFHLFPFDPEQSVLNTRVRNIKSRHDFTPAPPETGQRY
jgi:hypothetical protein